MCEENSFVAPEFDEEMQDMLENHTAIWEGKKEAMANAVSDNSENLPPPECAGE